MSFEKTIAFGVSMEEWLDEDVALIVIDVQNYCTNPEWKYFNIFNDSAIKSQLYPDYFERLKEQVIPNIIKLVNIFQEKSKKIFFVKYENSLSNFEDLSAFQKLIWNELKNKTCMSYEPGDETFKIISEVRKLISSKNIIIKKLLMDYLLLPILI